MTFDDFVQLVAAERPRRAVERRGAAAPIVPGMKLTDFLARPITSSREVEYRHILGDGATDMTIRAWEAKHGYVLPADLKELVRRADGIHLWANPETGRGYTGVSPIADWAPANETLGASVDARFVRLTYHADGAGYAVLDTTSGSYYLMDAAGPDTSCPIADSAAGFLDWVWRDRVGPLGSCDRGSPPPRVEQ
jgi:hypothetical protein